LNDVTAGALTYC